MSRIEFENKSNDQDQDGPLKTARREALPDDPGEAEYWQNPQEKR
jgi:hypothetical protein